MSVARVSRRALLQGAAAAGTGLVIGFRVGPVRGQSRPGVFAPSQWLRIDRDGRVTIVNSVPEMGQGTSTTMPMIVADELDVDLAQVRVEQAPANPEVYGNPVTGRQGYGGSPGLRDHLATWRRAGAAAREMLKQAAATEWGVPVADVDTEPGVVVHRPSGRRLPYGQLVDRARTLPVPPDPPLKAPDRFRYIGKAHPRIDVPAKTDGTAIYGFDVTVPGMLYASIERPPVVAGATVKAFDATAARQVKGVAGRRAGEPRRRGDRHLVLGGAPGPAPPARAVGRGAAGGRVEPGDQPRLRRGGDAAGAERAEGGRRREGAGGRRPAARGRLRAAVSRARVHGAHELHGARDPRRLRGVGPDPQPGRDAGDGGPPHGTAARQGDGPHDDAGRRLRPARRGRLRRRRRRGCEDHGRSREGLLDPRGRHPPRLLSTGQLPPGPRRARRERDADGVAPPDRRPRHPHPEGPAARKADWGAPPPAGRARGIAAAFSYGSYAAHVAEVSVAPGGTVRVHRIVCAIDCGIAVNPDQVRAQMEGGAVYALTAAPHGEITVDRGRVEQSNFHAYPMLRIGEMPEVEVHIRDSGEPPGGLGEPGVPSVAPAVTNALFALTGKRIRRLPIHPDDLEPA